MCGRYTLSAGHEALARAFLAEFGEEIIASWKPRYNIAPGTGILAILEDGDKGGQRKAEIFHWGLVPSWAKEARIGYKLVNARAETIAEKPSYRDAFRYRRCLVPASGFFEWDRHASPRQPYYVRPDDATFMAMAGVWEYWLHPGGSEIYSVALVTMPAFPPVETIHNRVPVILPEEAWPEWLDTQNVKPSMAPFLKAARSGPSLAMHPVSPAVNRADTDGPGLIERDKEPGPGDSGDAAVDRCDQLDLF